MTVIYKVRDILTDIYERFDYLVRPLQKFLLSAAVLSAVLNYSGAGPLLGKTYAIPAASALCMLLPFGGLTFVTGICLLVQMYTVSPAMALYAAVAMLFVCLLYFGFKPGRGVVIAVTMAALAAGIPYAVPLFLGLATGALSVVPALLGVLFWQLLRYFQSHLTTLPAVGFSELEAFSSAFRRIHTDFLADLSSMAAAAVLLTVGFLVVSLISKMSFRYVRTIAVGAGAAAMLCVLLIFGSPEGGGVSFRDVAALLLSALAALCYVQIFYAADYSGVERVQFEDDDFYYYVKAVPKRKTIED